MCRKNSQSAGLIADLIAEMIRRLRRRRLCRRAAIGILSVVLLLSVLPVDGRADGSGDLRTVQIFFENDLFSNTDKYYTNAVQAAFTSKDLRRYADDDRLPDWLAGALKDAPFIRETGVWHNVGIILGQQIYTPADVRQTGLIPDDRPYAGYLYGGLAVHRKTAYRLDTLEMTVGIVGPSSLAEQAQNTVHRLRHFDEALGWDNQLTDEPVFCLAWQRKWRFEPVDLGRLLNRTDFHDTGWGADWIPHVGISLGTMRTALRAGGEIRFGFRLPQGFGSDVIRPGAGIAAPVMDNRPGPHTGAWGIHLFAAAQAEFVARDIFLDGNTWKSSHSVEKEPWVAELSVGAALNIDTVKLTYRHLFRTRQFDNQSQGHTIGSLTLTWSF